MIRKFKLTELIHYCLSKSSEYYIYEENEGSPLLLQAHIEATTDEFVQKTKK